MNRTDDLRQLKRLTADADHASRVAAQRFARHTSVVAATDVAYAFADSPFGRLLVAVTKRGLVTLAYPNEDPEAVLARLAKDVSPRVLQSPQATDVIRRQLEEYFERRRR